MGRTSDARERLVEAGMDLFHARGYNAVGVNELCTRASVRKGSFYHFFPSKRDLVLAVIEAQWMEFQAKLLEPAFSDDLPPLDRIRRLFAMTCAYQESGRGSNGQIRGCPFGNLALELSSQEETIRERLEEVYRRIGVYFRRALEEHSPGIDSKARAERLVAFHQGTVLLAKTRNDPKLIEAMADDAVRLAVATAH